MDFYITLQRQVCVVKVNNKLDCSFIPPPSPVRKLSGGGFFISPLRVRDAYRPPRNSHTAQGGNAHGHGRNDSGCQRSRANSEIPDSRSIVGWCEAAVRPTDNSQDAAMFLPYKEELCNLPPSSSRI